MLQLAQGFAHYFRRQRPDHLGHVQSRLIVAFNQHIRGCDLLSADNELVAVKRGRPLRYISLKAKVRGRVGETL